MAKIMLSKPKLRAILLVILSVGIYSIPSIFGTPAPSVNRVVTPGAEGPCDWFVYLDGTTPVAQAKDAGLSVGPGDNVVGTAGQDPSAFIKNNLLAANIDVCLAAQTFVFTSSLTFTFNGVQLVGSGAGTVIKPSSGVFDVLSINGNDLNVHSMTIDTTSMTGGYALRVGVSAASSRCHLWNLNIQVGNTVGGIDLAANSGVCFVYGSRVQSLVAPTGDGIRCLGSSDHHIFSNDVGGFGSGGGIMVNNCSDVSLDANQVYVNQKGIIVYLPNAVEITGNHVGFNKQQGILVYADIAGTWRTVTIVGNNIEADGTAASNPYGIDLSGVASGIVRDITVTGNTISDYQGSRTQQYGVRVENVNIANVTITDNTITKNTVQQVSVVTCCPSGTFVVQNNPGYNAVGKITNFVTAGFFSPWGASATVVASTDYVVSGPDIFVTSTGGTGVSITVKDNLGNTVTGLSALATVTAQYIPNGYKINFGAFSGAPTVTVFAD